MQVELVEQEVQVERPLEVQVVLEELAELEVPEVLWLLPFLSWLEQLKPAVYLLHCFYQLILVGLVVQVEDLPLEEEVGVVQP